MNACVGPAFFPAIQIRLPFFQALEAHAFERRFFRVANPRFYFPFSIWIADPARQSHYVIMGENIPIQGVESRIVDVGNQHAFSQVVEVMCRSALCAATMTNTSRC